VDDGHVVEPAGARCREVDGGTAIVEHRALAVRRDEDDDRPGASAPLAADVDSRAHGAQLGDEQVAEPVVAHPADEARRRAEPGDGGGDVRRASPAVVRHVRRRVGREPDRSRQRDDDVLDVVAHGADHRTTVTGEQAQAGPGTGWVPGACDRFGLFR
jgi:hypothetical protein